MGAMKCGSDGNNRIIKSSEKPGTFRKCSMIYGIDLKHLVAKKQ